MSIVSIEFLIFILITVLSYYIIPQKFRWIILLLSSIVFYLTFSVLGICVLIVLSLISYISAINIQKIKDEYLEWLSLNKDISDKKTKQNKYNYYRKRQKKYILLSVLINLASLFLFKYYGVLSGTINNIFKIHIWTAENLLITLGISYYSFQLISYVIDVSRDIIVAEKNPLKIILYASFFLSIMQGPFNRYADLIPQITNTDRPKFEYTKTKFAIIRILVGYIKKICIADQIGIIVSEVFSNYTNYYGLGIVFGVLCFAIQLYADFSGYMDIIVGIGQLMGLRMPENFKQPFFSRNISEFWRRWHITLGLWLQDYVFYPILTSHFFKRLIKKISKLSKFRFLQEVPTFAAMLILWVLIGFWHGVGFNYIFGVGILQFIYIFIGTITKPLTDKIKKLLHINEKKLWWRIIQGIKCTVLMCFAWIFFRANSFGEAIVIIERIIHGGIGISVVFDSVQRQVGGNIFNWVLFIIFSALSLIVVDILHENNISINGTIASFVYPIRLFIYVFLVLTIIVFGIYGSNYIATNFIYFNF